MTIRYFSGQLVATWVACCLIATAPSACADQKEDEVKRKEAEIQRLKRELEGAQKEIKQLRKDLRQNPPRSTSAGAVDKPVPPLKPIATLPPLRKDEVVDATELVRYFAEDSHAAGSRFEGQTIQIKGIVDKFETKMFQRVYEVFLESPERTLLVNCQFNYEERFSAVHPIEDGQVLLGRINDRASIRLMKLNDTVTIQGKCLGLKGRRIVLTNCKVTGL